MFKELKKRHTKEPVLATPDLDKKIRMEVNVLDYITKRVLLIECKDSRWRLVAYFSKSLNETESNYKIHNKEMLVVISELENWKYLLESTKFKFEIWTNYKNFRYFMKAKKLNYRQAQWLLYLLRFDFTLEHVLGTMIRKVDKLNKKLDWKVKMENDNENQILIKKE